MSALLWAVVVSSTLAWAVFDVLRKRLAGKMPALELSLWLCAAQLPFYAVFWLLGPGATVPPGLWTAAYLWPALASVAFNVLANLLFLSAVARAELGATVPLLSLTPVFVALGSLPLLDERLSPRNWVGILLVTIGALFLPDARQGASMGERLQALARSRSTSYMIGTAALWAITPVCDKLALAHVPVAVHGAVLAVGVGILTLPLLALRRERWVPLSGARIPILTLAGGVNVLALGLQFIAISNIVVSVFEAFKRAIGLLLALGMGALFFSERPSPSRWAAGAVMAAGVVLVLWPAR